MNLTFLKCILNVMTEPDPFQHTKFDSCVVGTKFEIGPKCGLRLFLAIFVRFLVHALKGLQPSNGVSAMALQQAAPEVSFGIACPIRSGCFHPRGAPHIHLKGGTKGE